MSLEGQHFGEFEILERLGQGGMGAVYKAYQISLKRVVALKTLQSSIADDSDYIARFQQEAVAAARLNHPNLVQVYSAGESEGINWFAMEYVEGESGKSRLKRQGMIEPLEAIAIVMHVATALEYGWRKAGLIHRDIKPDNIFLSEDGDVKLGDLGLAKSAGQTTGLTVTGHSMGTPHYISPEQVQDMKVVDFRADIYSLGCTLFHMVAGRPPFDGTNAAAVMIKHITEPVPILKEVWPECLPVLSEVIERMMQKNPADRQQDYATLLNDLNAAYEAVSNGEAAPVMEVSESMAELEAVAPASPAPMLQVAESQAVEPQVAEPPAPEPEAVAVASQPKVVAVAKAAVPAKSKLPLVVGIAVGVLAIAGVCFFVFKPKEDKLTSAQTSAGAQARATPTQIAEPPLSAGSRVPASPAAEKWQDVLKDRSNLDTNFTRETSEGLLLDDNAQVKLTNGPAHGGAIRVRGVVGTRHLKIMADADHSDGSYELFLGEGLLRLQRVGEKGPPVWSYMLDYPSPPVPGTDYTAELRVAGGKVSARYNGQEIKTVTDPGGDGHYFRIWASPGQGTGSALIKSVEVLNLEAQAAATREAPSAASGPNSAGYPQPASWIDAMPFVIRGFVESDKRLTYQDGWLRAPTTPVTVSLGTKLDFRNAVVRARFTNHIGLVLRRHAELHDVRYSATISNEACQIRFLTGTPEQDRVLTPRILLPSPFAKEAVHDAAFSAQQDVLTLWVDGQLVATVHDQALTSGAPGVDFDPAREERLQKIEYGQLPDASSPQFAPVASGGWHDWVAYGRAAGRFAGRPDFEDDGQQLRLLSGREFEWSEGGSFRNGIVRVTWTLPADYNPSSGSPAVLQFRRQGDAHSRRDYRATFVPKKNVIKFEFMDFSGGSQGHPLKELPLPADFHPTDEFTLAVRIDEDRFTVLINDHEIGTVQDSTITGAGFTSFGAPAGARVRRFEFQSLDVGGNVPTSSAANPATAVSAGSASKDAPFVNSLGMKFVPVPGTKVLFSVWDTRVQDYKAYAAKNTVDDSWTKQEKDGVPVSREADYPVVGVSRDEAQAFIQWLTKEETSQGTIPNGARYRLPTDEEWSVAVGLGPEPGATPSEKTGKIRDLFPWGGNYPPTGKVGNYGDESFHTKFLPMRNEKMNRMDDRWIEGYNDGYVTTSPVGSFPANAHGLYDMGGNVWQWCEDWWDTSHDAGVLRGAAWTVWDHDNLFSSRRYRVPPNVRGSTYGFRCVLELPGK